MASYVCVKCGKVFPSEDVTTHTRCQYCGGKVFFKSTPPTMKKVSTE